jgi:hypothetical protein
MSTNYEAPLCANVQTPVTSSLLGHLMLLPLLRKEIPQGKKNIGDPGHKQEDNIKMYLTEIGYEDVDHVGLALDLVQRRAL